MSETAGYYRHPTIHGDTIVFVCEDDLWSVTATGGLARRLTASAGVVSFPRFSPDGKSIAFTAREEGPAEAYVVEADGGAPKKLTSFGSLFTITAGWKPDGASVVVATDAGQPFRGYNHLHVVPVAGGPSERAKFGPARGFSFDPDGRGLALARNAGDPARWKRYKGGTAGTLWIDREGNGEFAPLVKLDGNLANPMWFGGRVHFLSDHEGHGNLYSVTPDGKDLRRHTDHEDFYARFPSSDGKRIVYHSGADLFVFDPATGASKRVEVRLRSPRAQRQRKFVAAAKDLESFDLHPEGHSIAVGTRGTVGAMGLFDGPVSKAGGGGGVRARHARWLSDGKRIVGVSDDGGEEAVVVFTADGSAKPRRIEGDVGRALDLVASPAGPDRVAISNHRQELVICDLAAGTVKVADKSPFDRIDGIAWSPDGRHVAYGIAATRRTSQIRLYEVETGKVTPVTRAEFKDGQPAFDPEGKWLYFVSHRVFDPVYDSHYFDLGFPKGSKPFLVPLRKDLASPFASTTRALKPVVAPAPAPTPATPADAAKPAAGTAPLSPSPIVIDLDGIADRVVAFPVPEGKYLRVAGAPNRALFLSWPVEGSLGADWRVGGEPEAKGLLEAWDFETDKVSTVVSGVTSFQTSRDGKTLAVRVGNRLRALAATTAAKDLVAKEEPGRESGWIDLERVRVAVVPGEEWKQMYGEAWRLQRDHFWTPDMSGIDWRGIHDRYAPLVDRAATRSEFSDLMWEMQGELGTSHCYEMGGDYRPEPQWHVGFLGADLAFDKASGGWRIVRIPRGDSWEVGKAASPLSAPGLLVREGDVVTAVDGEPVGPDAPPNARLVHRAGRDVLVTIRGADGKPRTLAVRTLRDETPLRYRDWVEGNRAKVHAASSQKLGYVHIPNMGPIGYAEFHRAFGPEVDREGLVIDVRWNGGGHVSQLLLEKLLRRRVSYNASRWMGAQPYPDDAPMGPMVALTNEYAGSDGDIFSHSWKLFGLGPLLGKRTWGGVVGVWPRHTLVDGTMTTQPEFAFWFTDVGYAVEGHGTDPDIEVEIRPQDHAKGVDPQLDRAITEAMALVAKKSPKVPDLSVARPVRKPPTLPKRR